MTYSLKYRFIGESIEVSGRTKDEKIQVHEDYVRNESKLLKLHKYMLNFYQPFGNERCFFFNFELFLNFELFISFFGTENHENLTESYLKFWQIWKNKIVGPEKGSKFFSEINKKRRLDQNYFKNQRILEIFSKNKNP